MNEKKNHNDNLKFKIKENNKERIKIYIWKMYVIIKEKELILIKQLCM